MVFYDFILSYFFFCSVIRNIFTTGLLIELIQIPNYKLHQYLKNISDNSKEWQ